MCALLTQTIKQRQVQPCSLAFVGTGRGKFIGGNKTTLEAGKRKWAHDNWDDLPKLHRDYYENPPAGTGPRLAASARGSTAGAGVGCSAGVRLVQSKQEEGGFKTGLVVKTIS